MKLIWRSYLVSSLCNCVHETSIEISLIFFSNAQENCASLYKKKLEGCFLKKEVRRFIQRRLWATLTHPWTLLHVGAKLRPATGSSDPDNFGRFSVKLL